MLSDLEAVRTLLAFSKSSKRSPSMPGLNESPLTPQSSECDIESDEERDRVLDESEVKNIFPINLVLPKSPTSSSSCSKPLKSWNELKEEPQRRASVIMLAHRDGTLERTNGTISKPKPWNNEYEFGNFIPPDLPRRSLVGDVPMKNLPSTDDLPSHKTSGTEMTSGHRDKNIPSLGDVVASCGDGRQGSHIATSTHVPVFNNEPTNLIHHAKSKKRNNLKSIVVLK